MAVNAIQIYAAFDYWQIANVTIHYDPVSDNHPILAQAIIYRGPAAGQCLMACEYVTHQEVYERPHSWPELVAVRVKAKLLEEYKRVTMGVEIPPPPQQTVDAIYQRYENNAPPEWREHLGASVIGHECQRALWYGFRWATSTQYNGRMLRLFDTGHRQEGRMIKDLRDVGVTVLDIDPATGKQWRVSDYSGHFGGSMDALIVSGLKEAPKTEHVAEFKTHNSKSFEKLKKKGVKEAKPEHYAQMQIYMGMKGIGRAFYLAVCKDTDELHSERIQFNRDAFDVLKTKAKYVINSARPLTPIDDKRACLTCTYCNHIKVCTGAAKPEKNCRTCRHAIVSIDSPWICGTDGKALSLDDQVIGCDQYEPNKEISA